jgi:membrane protein implicated in regulation of membrane protease activity
MDDWLLWLIAAVIFGVGEIATLGFFLAPFAGGRAVAAVVSALGVASAARWIVFLVVSVVLLAALRPVARSHRRMPAHLRTGTAALVGKQRHGPRAHRQRRGRRLRADRRRGVDRAAYDEDESSSRARGARGRDPGRHRARDRLE